MKRFLFQVTAAGVLAACGLARPPLVVPSAPQRAGTVSHTRRIDFQNFTYKTGEVLVHVSNGRGTYKTSGSTEFSYVVEKVKAVYGDLTGDGKDEAAVILYFTGGGSGAFSKGLLFTQRKGHLHLLATFEGGDRADGGIREVNIENGILSVRREEPERMNGVPVGLCCPKYLVTTEYKWDGKRLVQVGEAQKVEASQTRSPS